MPYVIKGKVLDEDGYPLHQIAQIKEVNLVPGLPTNVSANIWSDPETGDFTFYALNVNAMIVVESMFYHPQTFSAKSVPAVIRLKSNPIEIVGEKKKPNNYLWWILAGFVGIVAIAANSGKKKPQAAAKAAPQPKQVTV